MRTPLLSFASVNQMNHIPNVCSSRRGVPHERPRCRGRSVAPRSPQLHQQCRAGVDGCQQLAQGLKLATLQVSRGQSGLAAIGLVFGAGHTANAWQAAPIKCSTADEPVP